MQPVDPAHRVEDRGRAVALQVEGEEGHAAVPSGGEGEGEGEGGGEGEGEGEASD